MPNKNAPSAIWSGQADTPLRQDAAYSGMTPGDRGYIDSQIIGTQQLVLKGVVTTTTASFTQPAVNSNVTVALSSTTALVQGLPVYVAGGGVYTVISVGSTTSAVLQNTGASGNASPAATVNSNAKVVGSGLPGTAGAAGNLTTMKRDAVADGSGNVTVEGWNNQPLATGMSATVQGQTWLWDVASGTFKIGTPSAVLAPVFFSALATLTPTATRQSQDIDGYSAVGDGGEGVFFWDAASTATADSGTVVAVTGISVGRWIRPFSGNVDVRWFGTPQTSTGNFADAGFALAITAAVPRQLPIFCPGDYQFNGSLSVGLCVAIFGAGRTFAGNLWYGDAGWPTASTGVSGTTLRFRNNAVSGILQTVASHEVDIYHLSIIGTAGGTSQVGIDSALSSGRVHLHDVGVYNFYCGISPGIDEAYTQEQLQITGNVFGIVIGALPNGVGAGVYGVTTVNYYDTHFSSNAYCIYVTSCQVVNFSGGTWEASSVAKYFGTVNVRDVFITGFYQELTGSVNLLASAIHSRAIPYGFTTSNSTFDDHVHMCTTPGTTTGTEPVWSTTPGGHTNWGTAQFTEIGPGGGSAGDGINHNVGNASNTFDSTSNSLTGIHFYDCLMSEATFHNTIGANGCNGIVAINCNITAVTLPANWSEPIFINAGNSISNSCATALIFQTPQPGITGSSIPVGTIPSPVCIGGVLQYSGRDGVNNVPFNAPYGGLINAPATPYPISAGTESFNPVAVLGQVARWKAAVAGATGFPYANYSNNPPALNNVCLTNIGRVFQQLTLLGSTGNYQVSEPGWNTGGLASTTTDSNGNKWTDVGAGPSWTPMQIVGSSVQVPITLAATGTTTLPTGTTSGQLTVFVMSTVTLTGAVTLALNGITGVVDIDFGAVTIGAFAVTITNGAGTVTATTLLATKSLLRVNCRTNATLSVG